MWFGAWRALPAQPKSLWHAPGYTSSETEQDPTGILGIEDNQTVANKGREGNAETKKEQPRNNNADLREGLGSASRDTYYTVSELFTKLKEKSVSCAQRLAAPWTVAPRD